MLKPCAVSGYFKTVSQVVSNQLAVSSQPAVIASKQVANIPFTGNTLLTISRALPNGNLTITSGPAVTSQVRWAHTDFQAPDWSAYRRDSVKNPEVRSADTEDNRKNFTYLVAGGLGVSSAYAAKSIVTHFVSSMSASADVLALAKIEIKLADIPEGRSVTFKWRGTCVLPPPKCNAFKEIVPKSSKFRTNYNRGNLPIAMEAKGCKVSWKADINKLDFHYYLPMFFEGLCETENPYKLFAQQGIHDMLQNGGQKIFPCIPQLIIPIKDALKTKNKEVMCTTLKVLQHLVKSGDMIGEALVPYYRQILPTLNLFKEKNVNCGDEIDYSQMRGDNLADIINETLEILERFGGEDAFINIKYLIPTYESCMMN